MKPIKIYGSNGEFNIDSKGYIIDKESMPDDYQHFNRFNINEYLHWLDSMGLQHDNDESQLPIDILDIGVWYGEFNAYDPPDESHRNEWAIEHLNEAKEKQKSINDSKLKESTIVAIVESFHTGQGRQMVELIDSYGLYDVWHDIANHLKDTYGELIDHEANYSFQQIVIQYHKIKYR